MGKTAISWADLTLNFIVGCTKKSKGCANCYAELAAASPRLQQFERYQQVITDGHWNGNIAFVPHVLEELIRKTKPKTVFMPSMSDPFHHNVKQEWLDKAFAAIALSPHMTIKMLTKRAERAYEYLSDEDMPRRVYLEVCKYVEKLNLKAKDPRFITEAWGDWVLPNAKGFTHPPWNNFQLGVSAEDQETANERIPLLLKTNVAYRFVSCEPQIELIDLGQGGNMPNPGLDEDKAYVNPIAGKTYNEGDRLGFDCTSLDEIIMGGESGSGSRPFECDWARFMAQRIKGSKVKLHLKQLGSNSFNEGDRINAGFKGQDVSLWPQDLQPYHIL